MGKRGESHIATFFRCEKLRCHHLVLLSIPLPLSEEGIRIWVGWGYHFQHPLSLSLHPCIVVKPLMAALNSNGWWVQSHRVGREENGRNSNHQSNYGTVSGFRGGGGVSCSAQHVVWVKLHLVAQTSFFFFLSWSMWGSCRFHHTVNLNPMLLQGDRVQTKCVSQLLWHSYFVL